MLDHYTEALARKAATVLAQETESLVARFVARNPDVPLERIEIVQQQTERGICTYVRVREDRPEPRLPGSDYQSEGVPAGYQTILGYLELYRHELLALMEDTPEQLAEDTKRDGYKLCHWATREGRAVLKVPAPPILRERGIEKVNAYPLDLLRRRFG